MITQVRIAPIERWCQGARKHAPEDLRAAVGRLVAIDTQSMWMMEENGEKFRNWNLVGPDLIWLDRIDAGSNSLCEHILEMD
jgi:hypothetical protein